ncbi:hypothetical protein C1645_791485 [Glomus cerebriforme]|uniref:Uncharacterized protein n=1 Tax=Glomus cerebriforme TaxID=658196 RepID=A0A397SE19_9GLOM|nr:hypothetical protein C1645_791485 [Glomus cerebriforme]
MTIMVFQTSSSVIPIPTVNIHPIDPLSNDIVILQVSDTIPPPLSKSAQKRQAALEHKCQKEAEALQRRRAFHLHIKNIKHSYNYHHPPLSLMLNASVGHSYR